MAKKKLTKELRLEIYKRMMKEMPKIFKSKDFHNGFCNHLYDIITIQLDIDEMTIAGKYKCDPFNSDIENSPCLVYYPELLSRVPDEIKERIDSGVYPMYYWECTMDGWEERKKVLREAIEELSNKTK